ncbi:hypothetical protein [Bacillus toyonensis]|uniref:hypothetical protein n=1 Tax=Bacillus toyonensis TaxID=155322 RepID=UPI001C3E9278|nr:hypothetical protein [Bacillus toyonensis]
MSCYYGSVLWPQLLVEGFGLSLTQASKYGKMEDYLLEEQIKEQRLDLESFLLL